MELGEPDLRGGRSKSALLERGTKILTHIAAVLLFVMMLHVCIDVAARLAKSPLMGTTEITAAYYMVAIVFLPLAYLAAIGANVTVDLFTDWLGPGIRRCLAILANVVGLFVGGLWLWQAVRAALHSTAMIERWEVGGSYLQVWPAKWIVVVALIALVVAFASNVARDAMAVLFDTNKS